VVDFIQSVYTGFLDVDQGAKHLFFYFFESRRDPDKGEFPVHLSLPSVALNNASLNEDDVMMWINGGMYHHFRV
jgi:carboxypeptidase C (cathepsin A)